MQNQMMMRPLPPTGGRWNAKSESSQPFSPEQKLEAQSVRCLLVGFFAIFLLPIMWESPIRPLFNVALATALLTPWRLRLNPVLAIAALWATLSGVSLLLSRYNVEASILLSGVGRSYIFAIQFALLAALVQTESNFRDVVRGMKFGLYASLVWVVSQYLYHGIDTMKEIVLMRFSDEYGLRSPVIQSIQYWPNYASNIAVVAGLFVFFNTGKDRWIVLAATTILAALSFSKSGIILSIVAWAFAIYAAYPRFRVVLSIGAVITLTLSALFIYNAFLDVYRFRSGTPLWYFSERLEISIQQRLTLVGIGMNAFAGSPIFGHGQINLGQYMAIGGEHQGVWLANIRSTHNDVTDQLVRGGLVGLCITLVFIGQAMRNGLRSATVRGAVPILTVVAIGGLGHDLVRTEPIFFVISLFVLSGWFSPAREAAAPGGGSTRTVPMYADARRPRGGF